MSKEESKKFIEELYANAMKLEDFEIGKPFMMSKNKWLCVDKGTWCVVAIKLGLREFTQVTVDESGKRTESTREVMVDIDNDPSGWLNGPTYACACSIIDADDFPACSKIE